LESIRVAVLTVSDRCAAGTDEDISGPTLVEAFREAGHQVALMAVVPDDRKQIAAALKRWSDERLVDVIVTTGGTGLSPRDVTPDVTRKVVDRELPSIAMYLLIEGMKKTQFAALSQACAGIRAGTLIVNLPGSPAAAKEAVSALLPILPHAASVIAGEPDGHPSTDPQA
jgi:molybdenum cofactor synthesis domain-containing protein